MESDRPTDELIQRMLAAVVGTFGGEERVERLVQAARAEAEAEVKDLLKAAIKATLLQRAATRLESAPEAPAISDTARPQEDSNDAPGPTGRYVYASTRPGPDAPPAEAVGIEPGSRPRVLR